MGSLMAGWGSPVRDPKSVKYRRNWSLTKEEIDAFWKLKKKTEEEHLNAISSPLARSKVVGADEQHGKDLQRSSSLPAGTRRVGGTVMAMESEPDSGWWTRSSWAFLNEPPVIERSTNTYVTQFHVANANANANADDHINSTTTKPQHSGISAN